MKKRDDCRLCKLALVASEGWSDTKSAADIALEEWPSFFLTPGLGAPLPGYLLITSREHLPCASLVAPSTIDELERAVEFTLNRIEPAYGQFVACEHGLHWRGGAGIGCVDHLHVHIFPRLRGVEHHLSQHHRTVKFVTLGKLSELVDKWPAYLWYRSTKSNYTLIVDSVLPSQYFRQLVCAELGLDKWDWREEPYYDNIRETVNRMLPLFGGRDR